MEIDTIYNGDSIELIKNIETESVHLILSDIPYGISFADWDILHDNTNSALGGSSPAQHKTGSGFKMRGKPINGWSEADRKIPLEYQNWVESWAKEWFRVLKPGASCFIFAGRRYAHRAIVGLENSGFTFRDMIGWNRSNATLKAQRISKVYERRSDFENAERLSEWRVGNLRPVFEPILWFTKPYKQGGTIADNMLIHGVGAYNLEKWQMFSEKGDNYIEIPNLSTDRGLHPTQKPLALMKALIELTTQDGQLILDPFAGSGTTLVAAKELNRHYLGFEINEEYYNNSLNRLNTLV
ncbi:TPA: site-specific DNA-methyltransferase [Streptococcus suis]|nr:site-specific DNA-methyltransferase [Streptococcus suis]